VFVREYRCVRLDDEEDDMPILQIEHGVRDFDAWKQAFDSDPVGREHGGVRRYRIARPTDDPSYVIVDLEFDSSSEAEAFRTKLRELWSRVEGELGLQNPQARIVEAVESKEY
jgi:hypothetical protein